MTAVSKTHVKYLTQPLKRT